MARLVLENFDDFIDYYELNEEIIEDDQTYDFSSNGKDIATDGPKGGPSPGFGNLADIKKFSDAGYFEKTPGFDKGMTLENWSKTDGYKECESEILKRCDGDKTKKVLDTFKSKYPVEYAAMVLYMTHEPLPRKAAKGVDRFSPFGRGGGGILGKRKGEISARDKSTAEQIIKTNPDKVPVVNSKPLPFQIPEKVDTSGFFPFNSWTLSKEFKDYLQKEFIELTKEAMKSATPLNEKDPKAFLQDLKIESSCSTITNKTSPEDNKVHTFKDLAERRAKSALDYLKEELEKIGVLIDKDTKITVDSDGENKGKKVQKGYETLTKGTDLTGTSGPEWDGKNTEAIKKFQQIHLSGTILINTSLPPKKEETELNPTFTVIPGKDEYKVSASFGKPRIHIPPPEIHIRLPRIGIFDFLKGDKGSIPCPKFGGRFKG
jgi:hypothetical protein